MKKSFWIFQNGGFFSVAAFSLKNQCFPRNQVNFCSVLKFFFLSVSSSKSDASNGENIFCSSKGSGDIHQKRSLDKQLDSCFCKSLYSNLVYTNGGLSKTCSVLMYGLIFCKASKKTGQKNSALSLIISVFGKQRRKLCFHSKTSFAASTLSEHWLPQFLVGTKLQG